MFSTLKQYTADHPLHTRRFLDHVGTGTGEGTWEGTWETYQLYETPAGEGQ